MLTVTIPLTGEVRETIEEDSGAQFQATFMFLLHRLHTTGHAHKKTIKVQCVLLVGGMADV